MLNVVNLLKVIQLFLNKIFTDVKHLMTIKNCDTFNILIRDIFEVLPI